MPGLLAIHRGATDPSLKDRVDALLHLVADGSAGRRDSIVDPGRAWAIGRSHHGHLQPPARPQAGPVHALLHGDLSNRGALADRLKTEGALTQELDDSSLLALLYERHGTGTAAELEGAFCAVVVDTRANEICLINDRVGSYPLFWAAGDFGLVAAKSVHAVLAGSGLALQPDVRAIASYLWFGLVFGHRTLAGGIEALPAASTLTWSPADRRPRVRPYWRLADAFGGWAGTKEAHEEAVGEAFNAAVARACGGNVRLGLSLSGGLDSRAVLSAARHEASSIASYTLGVKGCADEVIADRLSRIAGTSHRFFELDERYLKDYLPGLERMIALTDGLYLSHGLTEMLAVDALAQLNVDVLLRGHGGELAKATLAWPFHTDDRIHAMRTRGEFIPYFAARTNYISRGVGVGELFGNGAEAVRGGAESVLEEALAGVDLEPAQLCSYVYLNEHHRRFTIPSLELFRSKVDVRMPFADEQFLDVLLKAPARWRDGTDLHKHITGENDRRLLRVRNSNTGAPGDAGPRLEFVLDKVNSLFKRLNVHGYRHYHQFDQWMRDQLLTSVQSILLDPASLHRGLLREPLLRRLIDDTRSGVADRAYLLQVLLNVELWLRQVES
jgi:asparagine synthase (glutamine-hydrolysing)